MRDDPTHRDESAESLLGQVADEFTERLSRGEQPDVEDYARRYPQIAAVLREALPALLTLSASTAPLVGVAQLFAQRFHVHIDDPIRNGGAGASCRFHKLRASENAPAGRHQRPQHTKLHRRDRNHVTVKGDLVPPRVQLDAAGGKHFACRSGRLPSPKQGGHAGQQKLHRKRLRHVVVSAYGKTDEHIGFIRILAEHHHGYGCRPRIVTQLPDHALPGDSRNRTFKQNDAGRRTARLRDRKTTIGDAATQISLAFQTGSELFR